MYRINLLQRPVLITPDEVTFHAPIKADTAARDILQQIIAAEERIIGPAISDDLYYDFIDKKNVLVTSGNQASLLATVNASRAAAIPALPAITLNDIPIGAYVNAIEFVTDANYVLLWNMFLWKLTAEAVALMIIVPTWLFTDTAGQQMNNPEVLGGSQGGSVTGGMKDVKFKIDNAMQDRIGPLIARMHSWICNRKANYSLYTKKCDCDSTDGVSVARKTDWVFASSGGNCGCPSTPGDFCLQGILGEIDDCLSLEDGSENIGIE